MKVCHGQGLVPWRLQGDGGKKRLNPFIGGVVARKTVAPLTVLNAEKQKTKASVRSEIGMANKTGQQQLSLSHPVNHPLRGGTGRPDVSKTSAGKLLVLKPRENGISHTTKDSSSPTSSGRTVINPLAVGPSVGQAPMKNQNNPKLVAAERKATALPANNTPSMEKKPINSQAQSRNDFFNLMRRKTLTNNSSAVPDPGHVTSPTILEKSGEFYTDATNAVSTQGSDVRTSDHSSLNADPGVVGSNGDAYESSHRIPKNGEKHSSSPASLYPDEEEAAFLRSLGWEEDAGEEEGLTEEEINAFYQEYMKLKPSSKLCLGMRQSKLPLELNSCVDDNGGASESSSSESKSKS
ncbi:C-jun-amino-terminal kinase-interacting protein 3 protein [Thalictrum thalictroides]|uniref:C-jun-amino-terminal kinase-interacting protein 3 protein n=1 Tax=Thalictrum thalictroides TaxID=46969 RepID=A0A7J6X7I5_THATH|nr:C-jun-amino-terminal kinase-interacting protein 3 protein [Thalictrum thalictroides]